MMWPQKAIRREGESGYLHSGLKKCTTWFSHSAGMIKIKGKK